MAIKSKKQVIEYECRKKPTPEEHERIRERINDQYTLTGIDKMRAFYKLRGLEFDENMLDNIIRDYHLDE